MKRSEIRDVRLPPSLGLSGVVMGMLALFAYFLPRAKIRMFFWFLFSLGTIGIPAWIVAAWYIGWDLYDQLAGRGGYVNFVGPRGRRGVRFRPRRRAFPKNVARM